jgi:hypothetical protein
MRLKIMECYQIIPQKRNYIGNYEHEINIKLNIKYQNL